MGDRVWYAQKPEKMWTKQHDIFLYSDLATKPRPGVAPGVRVKLPGGKTPLIVRLPPRSAGRVLEPAPAPPAELLAQTEAEKVITVRIPTTAGKLKVAEEPPEGAQHLVRLARRPDMQQDEELDSDSEDTGDKSCESRNKVTRS